MRNKLKNYLVDEEEMGSFESGKEKPTTRIMYWFVPRSRLMYPRTFDEKSWERAADILSKWQAQWYQLEAPSNVSQIMHELSGTAKMEELKERITILEEQARQNKRLID